VSNCVKIIILNNYNALPDSGHRIPSGHIHGGEQLYTTLERGHCSEIFEGQFIYSEAISEVQNSGINERQRDTGIGHGCDQAKVLALIKFSASLSLGVMKHSN